ncbi:phosphatidate cytidylyltransferase [Kordiimonas pumila]|uniref:Phosphatidate cytidylyltransferase n=1 Tax=Kordiimonas pumila TaxID=2161677 RepID=A0ABV7D1S4_9PROT|nr:phosphatidate cytidylyltransferase [Kordiimonas pumila]
MLLNMSNNLLQRIVSAVLLLPPVLATVYFGGWWFIGLLALGAFLMAAEWSKLVISPSIMVGSLLGFVVIGALVVIKEYAIEAHDFIIAGLLVALVSYAVIRTGIAKTLGWWLLGVAYVSLPVMAMWWLHTVNPLLVLWVFLIVWGTDIGGYFAGKSIGGPKLAPRISPKKTWAGLLGGMSLAALASFVLWLLYPFLPYAIPVVVAAAGLAVWAQIGDLVESGIKRSFGVKDSGGLIPGHGGLLDRVDGLVFVAPAVALLVNNFPLLLGAG